MFDADENSEDSDRTMTAADLVTESGDIHRKETEDCYIISGVGTSVSSNVTVESDSQSDKTGRAKGTSSAAIRNLTSAVRSAKSTSEIMKIMQECSWKPSKKSSLSEPGKTPHTGEMNGRSSDDAMASCQSAPEPGRNTPLESSGSLTGNGTLTASTKSYSWSSSLPNGSRLETLGAVAEQPASDSPSAAELGGVPEGNVAAENTVTKTAADDKQKNRKSVSRTGKRVCATSQRTRESAQLERRGDAVSSATVHGSSEPASDRNHRLVDDADAAGDVAATSSNCSRSKSLRVGDFLPPQNDASETTFGSPRVSLIERLSRPRHFDDHTLDQSQYNRSVTVPMSSQPAASVICRLMSTPVTSASGDSAVCASSSQFRTHSSTNEPVVWRAGSHHSLSSTMSMFSIVDSTCCLSTGPLEDTVTHSLSQLPISYQNITNTSSAVTPSHVDAGTGDVMSFAGRIAGATHPTSSTGASLHFFYYFSFISKCLFITLNFMIFM